MALRREPTHSLNLVTLLGPLDLRDRFLLAALVALVLLVARAALVLLVARAALVLLVARAALVLLVARADPVDLVLRVSLADLRDQGHRPDPVVLRFLAVQVFPRHPEAPAVPPVNLSLRLQ